MQDIYIIIVSAVLAVLLVWSIYKTEYQGDFQNSLFKNEEWQDRTVMVVVPHQDDEINLAGATIRNLVNNNIWVILVFITNSDSVDSGPVRIREGLASAAALGVPEEDVIFLGYCNETRLRDDLHFYNGTDDNEVVTSVKGISETYCLPEKPEFYFEKTGEHHKFTKANCREDLKEVILQYYPDIIFACDFDRHQDHKAYSLLFEEAVAEILKETDNDYLPEIYKGFAYNGSYLGEKDFYRLNLLETKQAKGEFINNPNYDTDCPPYLWSERVRVPVPREALSRTLHSNIIYTALRKHFSQGIIHNAKRIINSDQVFWERRTDSLTYQAEISVSSGDGSCLNDFKLCDCPDVLTRPATFSGAWVPNKEDKEKKITIKFSEPKDIKEIVLYGNEDYISQVLTGTITFDNGYSVDFGELKRGCKATNIEFEAQEGIRKIEISLTITIGDKAGITEIEIFDKVKRENLLRFIKLMINDNFAYEYYVTGKDKVLDIDVYKQGIEEDVVYRSIDGGDYRIENGKLFLGKKFTEAIIRAEVKDNPAIYDQIVVKRKSSFSIVMLHVSQVIDMLAHRVEHIVKTYCLKMFKPK